MNDAELLRAYADQRSEAAFAEIVRRHLDLVYNAALRRCGGDRPRAEDVTQQVFTVLARRAAALTRHAVLAGWLYTTTRNLAFKAMRSEQNRRARERVAHAMNDHAPAEILDWEKLRPALDDVLDELPPGDRDAILLRFFENRAFREIGRALRLSDDAARMKVERALDKLRRALGRRGVTSTSAALGLALAGHVAVGAPAGLATTITTGALASAAAAAGASGPLVGIFAVMTTTTKITIASLVLAAAIPAYVYWRPAALQTTAAEAVKKHPVAAQPSSPAPAAVATAAPRPAPPATDPAPVPRPPGAGVTATSSALPSLETAKQQLARVGSIRDVNDLDPATVATMRAWVAREPQESIRWLTTVSAENRQREHTTEALVAILADSDPEAAFLLAGSISREVPRANRMSEVLRRWAPRDPAAARAAVQAAELSEDRRQRLLRTVDAAARPPR